MEYAFVTSRLWFRGVASSGFVLGRFDFQKKKGDEQEDDEQGNDKGKNSLQEHHQH